MDAVMLALLKKYTQDAVAGLDTVRGAPCQIQSISDAEGGKNVTFLWEDNDGETQTTVLFVPEGAPGKDGKDGAPGPQGPKGDSGTDDELTAAVFRAFKTGRFEIPITTRDGEAICSREGVTINAWTDFGGVS